MKNGTGKRFELIVWEGLDILNAKPDGKVSPEAVNEAIDNLLSRMPNSSHPFKQYELPDLNELISIAGISKPQLKKFMKVKGVASDSTIDRWFRNLSRISRNDYAELCRTLIERAPNTVAKAKIAGLLLQSYTNDKERAAHSANIQIDEITRAAKVLSPHERDTLFRVAIALMYQDLHYLPGCSNSMERAGVISDIEEDQRLMANYLKVRSRQEGQEPKPHESQQHSD